MQPKEALDVLERAAVAGAQAMLSEIRSGRAISAERKEDFTYVLNLDLLSDQAIRSILSSAGSQIPVVSEEHAESHALLGTAQEYFLVDPLDGTNNCRRALNFFGPELRPMQEGFGPLVGYVSEGRIVAAVYVSLTEQLVWSAIEGGGARCVPLGSGTLASFESRPVIVAPAAPRLRECGVVFYPGRRGELELLNALRQRELIDGCYRCGGFANDCTRIARGREQILIQFSLKAWDLVAGLIAVEAGAAVLAYRNGQAVQLTGLCPHPLEKIILAQRGCVSELMNACRSDESVSFSAS